MFIKVNDFDFIDDDAGQNAQNDERDRSIHNHNDDSHACSEDISEMSASSAVTEENNDADESSMKLNDGVNETSAVTEENDEIQSTITDDEVGAEFADNDHNGLGLFICILMVL